MPNSNQAVPDKFSKETRSRIMASIRGKNTEPEMMIRKTLWSQHKRYRIHDKSVIGTPDISIKRKKVAIFIDGCFWHGCKRCYKEPRTNTEFWRKKIEANKTRRGIVNLGLQKNGWMVLEFWEHEVYRNKDGIVDAILQHL